MAKVLLTGVTGYIGKRLLQPLLDKEVELACVVRDKKRFKAEHPQIEVYEADFAHPETFAHLPKNIDAAYYLLHSLHSGPGFEAVETAIARNFAEYISTTQAQQIVFLSGISNDDNLSEHLRSRRRVEEVLRESGVPVTVLRAAIIVGSGSASFEIIRDLVEKLPVMVAPRWVETRCQPIAIRNVIQYLTGVLLLPDVYNQTFDIGGPEVLTYKQMLQNYAQVRHLRRVIITVPVLTPRLSSYWLYFVTGVSYPLAKNLVSSMQNEVVASDNRISELIPVDLIVYSESLSLALDKVEQNMVVSSWSDALNKNGLLPKLSEFINVPQHGVYSDVREEALVDSRTSVISRIFSIGGETGWYYANWLWTVRGLLDRVFGGAGLQRGRRSAQDLKAGDALDFWRVLFADRKNGRLLLYAEMKLPGEAWLEFRIVEQNDQPMLQQTATFRPKGLAGRLYWLVMWPFHQFIFKGMAQYISGLKK